jgi:hypothetical protein
LDRRRLNGNFGQKITDGLTKVKSRHLHTESEADLIIRSMQLFRLYSSLDLSRSVEKAAVAASAANSRDLSKICNKIKK